MAQQGCSGVLLELNAQAPGETLPTCIKERLESRRRPAITLEAIHARLQRAARKRQEVQERQQPSRARKAAASPPSEEERAARLARELQERLDAAEAARAAAFDARQRRAAAAAKRASAVRAMVEARAAEDARQREAALNARLSRAAAMRWASLAAKVSSQPESPSQFLQQHAAKRAAHRRDRAATQLQRFWRKVVSGGATSRQLAAAFAGTGLPQGPAISTGAARQQRPSQAQRSPARRPGFGFITMEPDENEEPEEDPFDTLADQLHAPATLAAAGALLRRLEARLQARGPEHRVPRIGSNSADAGGSSAADGGGGGGDGGKSGGCSGGGGGGGGKSGSCGGGGGPLNSIGNTNDAAAVAALAQLFPRAAAALRRVPRYPTRVFLTSYMIRAHAMVVFNTWGERERRLAASARRLSAAMDSLLAALLAPRPHGGTAGCDDAGSMDSGCAFGGTKAAASGGGISGGDGGAGGSCCLELAAFDGAWAEYVGLFAAWKGRNAAALEEDLIRAAVELERSRLRKLLPLGGLASARMAVNEDLQILVHHVGEDQALLRSKCLQLRGAAGAARMDAALSAARAEEEARHAHAVAEENLRPAPQGPSTPPRPAPLPPRMRGRAAAEPPQRRERRVIDPAQQQRDAMLWELLHDAHWQLPTAEVESKWADATGVADVMTEPQPDAEELAADPAAAAAAVQRRIRRIAEQAFWDARAEALASADPEATIAAAEGFVTLLGDLGRQLADALPQDGGPVAERVAATLGPDTLRRRLGELRLLDGPHGARELLAVLEEGAVLLAELGAPARVEAAAAARAAIAKDVVNAAGDRVGTAKAVTQAVRLLAAQLQMLRLDAANAHLRMLSVSLSGGAGIRHARSRFLAAYGLPQGHASFSAAQLAAALPATAAWLAAAVGQLPAAEAAPQRQGGGAAPSPTASSAACPAAPSSLSSAGSSKPPTALPAAPMRAGTVGPSASVSAAAAAAAGVFGSALQPAPAARLLFSTDLSSWRAAVRCGLVALVAGQEPLGRGGSSLPETLEMETRRLAEAQAAYQRLLVGVAATLLLREHAASTRGTLLPDTLETARRRLAALLADPATQLPHIAAELAALAGSRGDASTEETMRCGLQRLLARGSGGFKGISNGLTTALRLRLLLGGGAGGDAASAAALARCGAAAFATEVDALAVNLGQVAAVSEAVHGDTYTALVAGA